MENKTKSIYLAPQVKTVSFHVELGVDPSLSGGQMERIEKSTGTTGGNEEVGGLFGGPSF